MTEKVIPGPVSERCAIREAVSIHTTKIFDSCRDKDCVEDLRLYLTPESQTAVDNAVSVRARGATLMYCDIVVDEVSFNRGYYTLDIRYYYKIQGEAAPIVGAPVEITGLAIFDKRVMLYGSEGNSKVFTSKSTLPGSCCRERKSTSLPTAVVEAIDPIVLSMNIVDVCEPCCDCGIYEVPAQIYEDFGADISFANTGRRVFVSLGQFSIISLERDTQLLMPSYDYYMPEKECIGSNEDDACTLFSRIHFPVEEFFPPDTLTAPEGYREVRTTLGG